MLVHGLIISSLYMIPLGEQLSRLGPVHAVDLPGFGRSEGPARALSVVAMARALAEWLEAAQIGRCHLVANSLGCQFVTEFAVHYSERCASLTLIGPTIDDEAHSLARHLWRMAREMPKEPAALWLNYTVDLFRAGPVRVVTMVREMFADRIGERLGRVHVPTLVLRGSGDPIAPRRWIERVASLLPRASCREVPKADHCVHYSHPVEVAGLIGEFVRALER